MPRYKSTFTVFKQSSVFFCRICFCTIKISQIWLLGSDKDEYSKEGFNLNCLVASKFFPFACLSCTIVLRGRHFGAPYLGNSSNDASSYAITQWFLSKRLKP